MLQSGHISTYDIHSRGEGFRDRSGGPKGVGRQTVQKSLPHPRVLSTLEKRGRPIAQARVNIKVRRRQEL